MKQTVLILLAGIACIFMIAAGCTSSTGSAATVTPTATTEAAAAATTAAAQTTTVQSNVTAAATAAAPDFAGNWNATYTSSTENATATLLALQQTGSAVTGTYTYGAGSNSTGSIKGTVAGSVLTGTWSETFANTTVGGPLAFTLSADGKSFTGKWANDSDAAGTINTTTNSWNGVRV
jgi:hypothetical protein